MFSSEFKVFPAESKETCKGGRAAVSKMQISLLWAHMLAREWLPDSGRPSSFGEVARGIHLSFVFEKPDFPAASGKPSHFSVCSERCL